YQIHILKQFYIKEKTYLDIQIIKTVEAANGLFGWAVAVEKELNSGIFPLQARILIFVVLRDITEFIYGDKWNIIAQAIAACIESKEYF
ncbi:hypothetical protein ACJX0J_035651, partial [Zea mays]